MMAQAPTLAETVAEHRQLACSNPRNRGPSALTSRADDPPIQDETRTLFFYLNYSLEVIRLVIMVLVGFPLLFRNVGDLLFRRGTGRCHETLWMWRSRVGTMLVADIGRQTIKSIPVLRHRPERKAVPNLAIRNPPRDTAGEYSLCINQAKHDPAEGLLRRTDTKTRSIESSHSGAGCHHHPTSGVGVYHGCR